MHSVIKNDCHMTHALQEQKGDHRAAAEEHLRVGALPKTLLSLKVMH